jgi:uncharacterized phage protein (TIGR02218 family)
VPFDSEVYVPTSAFDASAIASKADMSVDNMEVVGVLNERGIEAEDIEAGRWDYTSVRLLRVNWRRPQDGAEIVRVGTLGKLAPTRGGYVAELRGLMQALQTNIGELVTPTCRANLGDARCLFPIESLRNGGTIVEAITRRAFIVDGLTEPDGFFDGGDVLILTGLNAGIRIEVRQHIATSSSGSAEIELQLLLPYLPIPGDAFSIVPGCDKTKTMCIGRYDNLIHFRGFDFVPGPDSALQIGGQ